MKKIILIGILICVLAAVLIMGYAAMNNMGNSTQYERVNLSATCSLELPKIHFDVQNSSSGGSYDGINMNVDGKIVSADKLVIEYVKVTDNTGISSSGVSSGNSYSKIGHMDWYSRDVTNLATGESILVCGENKEVVDRIADSIQFKGGNNNTSNSTSTSNGGKQINNTNIVGYDSDGNPVYAGSEPWIWVDSNGMKHWSPEHQKAAEIGYYDSSSHSSSSQSSSSQESSSHSSPSQESSGGSSVVTTEA